MDTLKLDKLAQSIKSLGMSFKAEFNEADHPRANAGESNGGQFTSGGGSGGQSISNKPNWHDAVYPKGTHSADNYKPYIESPKSTYSNLKPEYEDKMNKITDALEGQNRAEGKLVDLGINHQITHDGYRSVSVLEAKHMGYDVNQDEIDQNRFIHIPLVDEEKQAIQDYNKAQQTYTEINSDPDYKYIRTALKLARGKVMQSKYPGTSALTGEKFSAGTDIYFGQQGFNNIAAPTSEVKKYVK